MSTITYLLAGALGIGYIILIGVVRQKNLQLADLRRWLIGTLIIALLAQSSHLIQPITGQTDATGLFGSVLKPSLVSIYLTSLMLVGFLGLTLRYLERPGATLMLLIGFMWLAGLIFASLGPGSSGILGSEAWISQLLKAPLDIATIVALAGWGFIGIVGLLVTFYSFYNARLPEIGNHSLFWVIIIPLVVLGAVLGVSGSNALQEIGWLTQFAGMIGVVYGVTAVRVFDIRRVISVSFSSALVTGLTAWVILAALLVARSIDPAAENGALILVALALLTAVFYAPLRSSLVSLVNRVFGGGAEDTARILRRYSQDVSGVVELNELVDVAMNALRNTLKVRRGGLILATRDDNDTIRIEPMAHGLGEMPEVRGWIPKGSPIYKALFEDRLTLLQFDLEYARPYVETAPELKSFFKQLGMSAYAPVVVQSQLIGILAAGAKNSDIPFYPQDLELLATIANQTGVALRNARLVNDLRSASENMQELNKDLVSTKERIERLDAVKTDFITIASHELRTPLAQIRGYTDIIDALNEQGMLDPDQVTGMTTNLRKATDRLERLIGDMLDVSQLGLDAMDLRFAQTTAENVIRLAIEPLTESIKQRKLTLTARGLRGLPPVEADMQRLVQAFRNVITNAIKYTPDGGRIDITANIQPNEQTKRDEVLVAIQDTGIGIDPTNQDLIFEKFFRVSDPGLHSTGATKFMGAGPGLGLTIARGVIEGHGGRIWVESPGYDPEKLPGSTFYIVLPLAPPEDAKRVLAFEGAAAVQSAATAASTPLIG
jgi:signal transduction histidine kinase